MAYTGNWASDPASSNFATPELYEGYLQAGGAPMPGSSYQMGDVAPASNYAEVAAGATGGNADILAPGFGSKNWAQNPLAGNFATPQAFIDYYKQSGDATGGIKWGQTNDERISPNFANAVLYQKYLDQGGAPFQLGGKESGGSGLGNLAKLAAIAAASYYGFPMLGEALGGAGALGAGELAAAGLPEFAGTMAGSSGVWGAGGGLLGGAEAAGGLGGLLDAGTGADIASAFGSGTAPFVPAAPAATGLETFGAGGLESLTAPVMDAAGTTLSDAGLASLVTGTPAATYGPTLANALSQGLGSGLPSANGLPNIPPGSSSALSSIAKALGISESTAKMLGIGASTGLGVLGSLYSGNQAQDLANRYEGYGAPFRAKANEWLANPASFYGSDFATQNARAAAQAVNGKMNAQDPNGQLLIQQSLAPQYLNSIAQMGNLGGLGNYNAAAPQLAQQANQGTTNAFNAVGSGLNDIFNPKSSLTDQLATLKGLLGGKSESSWG